MSTCLFWQLTLNALDFVLLTTVNLMKHSLKI